MLKVGHFPQFEDITPVQAACFNALTEQYPPYSEFNYTNLLAWHSYRQAVQLSSLNNALITRVSGQENRPQAYTLLGSVDLDDTLTQVLASSPPQTLRRVPGSVVSQLERPDGFHIVEDRDNHEYILSAEDHAKLVGPKNQGRRNLVQRFIREHGQLLDVVTLDLADTQAKTDINDCMASWIKVRSKDDLDATLESQALSRTLDAASILPIQSLGFYMAGVMRGFSIFEYAQQVTGFVHFEKADVSYRGLPQFIRQSVAKLFLENGVKYINYEQDMGIPGLRTMKTRLHPVGFLKKYSISATGRTISDGSTE
jgi:hypothetical protein